jgi:hypothetical protein
MSLRKATLAAVAALLALGGAGAAAWYATSGDDDPAPLPGGLSATRAPEQRTESTPTAPEAEPPAPDPTGSEPAPDPTPPEPAAQPNKHQNARKTKFPPAREKPSNDPPQRRFSVPPAREFSGTGNATLGNVNLRQPAVVKWTTQGRFELRFGREDFPIVAPSASGQLVVPSYNFERVRVIAHGRWKISITPQG